MDFEVLPSANAERYRLQWTNPWGNPIYLVFRAEGERHFLTDVDFGRGLETLPRELLYWDFGIPEGGSWRNEAGEFSVVSAGRASVTTSAGVFERCTVIRHVAVDSSISEWTFALDVGIIKFSTSGSDFEAYGRALLVPVQVREELDAPANHGFRILGLDINPAPDEEYDAAFARARKAGVQTVSLTVNWEDLEPDIGQYLDRPNWLSIAADYYPPKGATIDLFVISMDPRGRNTPRDLRFLPFDHPSVIERYKLLLENVFAQLPAASVNFLGVGSEVDLGLAHNAEKWASYTTFLREIRSYVKSRWPELRVGASVTLNGAIGHDLESARALNDAADLVLVSYYPVTGTFRVRPASVVRWDIDRFMELYPDHQVIFEQTGYPSRESTEGSEEAQAAFVREMFKAWDRYRDRIPSITFTWLTDLSDSAVAEHENYYRVYDNLFGDFLRSLGFRRVDGSDKPALTVLETEAAARGWLTEAP